MNSSTYVYVFVDGYFLEKNFFIKSTPEISAREIFKAIDAYKRKLSTESQDRISAHVWGDYEHDLLISSGIAAMEVPSCDILISHCKVLLGE